MITYLRNRPAERHPRPPTPLPPAQKPKLRQQLLPNPRRLDCLGVLFCGENGEFAETS